MRIAPTLAAVATGLLLTGCGTPPTPSPEASTLPASPTTASGTALPPSETATPSAPTGAASATSTETAIAPAPTAASTATAQPSDTMTTPVVVVQSSSTLSVMCHNAELIVQAENAVISAEGTCVGVIVIGDENRITVSRAEGEVKLYGSRNRLTYSGDVSVRDHGTGNTATRR
ncbi:DUF3060 domain-containing protein [Propionicicella superfundia]|uniref:DUF3060 domain-containing protein n=1 Tax=Propionicicella superfundia TaxID=348582 RepID=UPI00048E6EE6|nr:DUF3060 domain-containing protein [Propionicicella superfundia]